MKSVTIAACVGLAAAAAFIVFVPQWNSLPIGTEIGITPTQMVQFDRGHIPEPVSQSAPAPLPPAPTGGPRATETYHNVQVLTDVSADEFMRLQHAITAWVSPAQGCAFCHVDGDAASDAKPTKAAARVMLRMVRAMNTTGAHVAPSGVTCFTCHRGQPVPAETWFPSQPTPRHGLIAKQDDWRESADTVHKFFPDAGSEEYLVQNEPIVVESATTLPSDTRGSFVETTRIYEMMMQMSDGIGVNCGYCHNSRAFSDWSQSSPQRWSGMSGLTLTRTLNREFLPQLAQLVPQSRQIVGETALPVLPERDYGRQIGNGLVVCATCHYGEPKPLAGAPMLQDYPGLSTSTTTASK